MLFFSFVLSIPQVKRKLKKLSLNKSYVQIAHVANGALRSVTEIRYTVFTDNISFDINSDKQHMLSSDVRTQQDCNIMYTGFVCLLPSAAESFKTLFSLWKLRSDIPVHHVSLA